MLKLQVDLKTLEDMIGGDTPFHLEIREGIIQTFAKHHLKSLVNSETLKGLTSEILKDLQDIRITCQKEIMQYFPVKKANNYLYKPGFVLDLNHPMYKGWLEEWKTVVEQQARKAIKEVVNEVLADTKKYVDKQVVLLREKLEKEVDKQFKAEFYNLVNKEIVRRLNILIQEEKEKNPR